MEFKCFFSGRDAIGAQLANGDGYTISVKELGKYWISGEVNDSYKGSKSLTKKHAFICLQETAKLNQEGLIPAWTIGTSGKEIANRVVTRSIEDFRRAPINHIGKDLAILQALARNSADSINQFASTRLVWSDRLIAGIFDDFEYFKWIDHLNSIGEIYLEPELEAMVSEGRQRADLRSLFIKNVNEQNKLALTVSGWDRIQKSNQKVFSRKVFVAMAFTDKNGDSTGIELRDCIRKTLEELNCIAIVVDEVEHNDGIMDRVIASINESRFVLADLTHQKSGVYYEAGYAKGRGLPVIHLVKNDNLDKCHFDVKHLNLIVWSDLDDLRKRLNSRIRATIT